MAYEKSNYILLVLLKIYLIIAQHSFISITAEHTSSEKDGSIFNNEQA